MRPSRFAVFILGINSFIKKSYSVTLVLEYTLFCIRTEIDELKIN